MCDKDECIVVDKNISFLDQQVHPYPGSTLLHVDLFNNDTCTLVTKTSVSSSSNAICVPDGAEDCKSSGNYVCEVFVCRSRPFTTHSMARVCLWSADLYHSRLLL